MLAPIILREESKKIKYHDQVKYLVFRCNNCSKEFSKAVSYYKKQQKRRSHPCCFCSPACRSKYFFNLKNSMPVKTETQADVKVATPVKPLPATSQNEEGLMDFIKKIFG